MRDVKAPDGRRWRLRRRWISRKLSLKKLDDALSGADLGDFLSGFFDEIPVIGLILAAVGLAIFIFFGLAFVIELLIVLALLFGTVVARFIFRRPWIVEASTNGQPKETRYWHVVGWRRTNEVMRDIAQALQAGTDFSSIHAVPLESDVSGSSAKA